MTIDVEKDRSLPETNCYSNVLLPGAAPNINVRDDINSTFLNKSGMVFRSHTSTCDQRLTVLQKKLASIFLPDLVIENNGNITDPGRSRRSTI